MADRPDEVNVQIIIDRPGVMYRINVSAVDFGKLIGQSRRTARSLRQIPQAVAMTQRVKIGLDLGCKQQANHLA
jgi:predicted RNA-binding protein YlqC (UPF0109 family)